MDVLLQYKTAAYSALVKSQHHVEEEELDEEESVANDVKGHVTLHVLRDAQLQKIISSFLSMNDKLSLIFAVSEEEEEEGGGDQLGDGSDDNNSEDGDT